MTEANQAQEQTPGALTTTTPAEESDLTELIERANMAEKAMDALTKLKRVALRMTSKLDWVDMKGKPYMQETGAAKVAPIFGVEWKIDGSPTLESRPDGHFTYTYQGAFWYTSKKGIARTVTEIGSRSSYDDFFSADTDGAGKRIQISPLEVDHEDVKKAAYSNCIVRGVTNLLGLRNLTWEDVEAYTGFKRNDCGKVTFAAATNLPNYGPSAGKSLADPAVSLQDLKFYLERCRQSANDPNSKFAPRDKKLSVEIEKEIARREKPADAPPADPKPVDKGNAKPAPAGKHDAPTFAIMSQALGGCKSLKSLEDMWHTMKQDALMLTNGEQEALQNVYDETKAKVWTT